MSTINGVFFSLSTPLSALVTFLPEGVIKGNEILHRVISRKKSYMRRKFSTGVDGGLAEGQACAVLFI